MYTKKGHDQKEFEYNQGVQYRRISATADEKFDYLASGIDKRLSRLINFKRPLYASSSYYLMYALRVAKDLRSEKSDIVHIHTFSQFVPIIRALNPKIRIVLHMHCEWLTQLDRKRALGAQQLYDAYRKVGVTLEEFEGPRYRRISHIEERARRNRGSIYW